MPFGCEHDSLTLSHPFLSQTPCSSSWAGLTVSQVSHAQVSGWCFSAEACHFKEEEYAALRLGDG